MVASRVNVRELQAPLKERYRADPAAAHITLHASGGESDLADPLHATIRAGTAAYRTGAHPGVGGVGDVPCSGDLLLAALAACQEITLRMVAAAMGIEITALEVAVEGSLDLRGTMGLDRTVPVGFESIHCHTRVQVGETNPERARRLLENAERYCVVLNTLRNGVAVESTFALDRADEARPGDDGVVAP